MASFTADEVDVQPEQVADAMREGDVQVVDVREDHEWDAGRIPGARHIGLTQVAAAAGELDRERPLVFYCRVGGRSAMAADAFRRAGFQAHSMDGGLEAWAERGLPLDPADGRVADH